MKRLLSKPEFKPTFISRLEREIVVDLSFPWADPEALEDQIHNAVTVALGKVLRTHAEEKTEKQLWKKFKAEKRKSLDRFERDLKKSGL